MNLLRSTLRRDPAHIKDDMRRTAARSWGLSELDQERIDPLVDLLLGAFAQELFTLQQEVALHKRRTLEIAVQAMLPEDLAAPRPAHAVMHGRPVDPGTWTHRTRTTFSATQRMDVHDRTGTAFSFTPVNEFRLYNGAVRHIACGDRFFAMDAKTGQRRNVAVADRTPLPAGEFWIGIELNERIDPANGLPLFFSLPTGDREAATLIPQLASCTFQWAGQPLLATAGAATRHREALTFEALTDPVRAREREALAYYQPQFISLRAPDVPDLFKQASPPPDFSVHFGTELTAAMDGRVHWLRMGVPKTMDPASLSRLNCAMNCFPVLNRVMHERTAASSRLLPLSHASELQFWAVDEVIDSHGKQVPNERTPDVRGSDQDSVYAVRRGGMERLDEREAYERLTGLLDTVRNDHAAFAALGETELARGLGLITDWLEEYKARDVTPGYPPVYALLHGLDHRNTHIHYWATNGTDAARIPALKPFQLNSGAYLAECRSITAPAGGTDTPAHDTLRDRLRTLMGPGGQGLPTTFMVRALCYNALPEAVRAEVDISVAREVAVGDGPDAGFQRVLAVTLRSGTTAAPVTQWQGYCDHLCALLTAQFKDLLPIRVRFQQQP